MTVDIDKERRAFEAFFEGKSQPSEHSNWFRRSTGGEYELDFVEHQWSGWMLRAEQDADPAIKVCVKRMRKSDDNADYFVAINVDGREVTPHVFSEEFKAAYHVALYNWVLNGTEKPKLMAFAPNEWPAQPSAEVTVDAKLLQEVAILRAALETIRKDGEAESHPCGPQIYNHFGDVANNALLAAKGVGR
jgi:hypothetical protein